MLSVSIESPSMMLNWSSKCLLAHCSTEVLLTSIDGSASLISGPDLLFVWKIQNNVVMGIKRRNKRQIKNQHTPSGAY
jgi:hypothetical protein